jgi:hypothetical protein
VGGIPLRATSAPATTPAVTPDVLAPNGAAAHGRPGAQAMRVEHTLVELAQSGDRRADGWRADPELATQVEEALARVPLRRRRVVLGVLDGLTQRQAVINAGYRVGSPQSASQMAQQIMRDPAVQHAYQALLEARGLSGAKLDSIHALFLSRHSAVDGSDRDRSLRALALARKYLMPRPVGAKPVLDEVLDEMTADELRTFAESGRWPARFAPRLRAAGWQLRPCGAATTSPVGPHHLRDDPADDAAVPAPPPEPALHPARPAGSGASPAATPPPVAEYGGERTWPASQPTAVASPTPALRPSGNPSTRADPGWGREVTDATELAIDPALRAMAIRDRRW